MKDLPLSPSSDCSEINQVLSGLILLSWLSQQRKERRRLLIASLEFTLDSSSVQPQNLASKAGPAAGGTNKRGGLRTRGNDSRILKM